ncbi:unnamed protein product [Brassicogethes aeneus]|uniref:Uncharacterized protein n=1 Tax=Brassicogethes aeneus TaxID=1431903 RepID=A0A9P0BI62_BRAAE|nr:unnamed protein product [Brassicogethes aeneus]
MSVTEENDENAADFTTNLDKVDTMLFEHFIQGQKGGSAFFKDNVRKVHFILVLPMRTVYNEPEVIEFYIRTLELRGLDFEQEIGVVRCIA